MGKFRQSGRAVEVERPDFATGERLTFMVPPGSYELIGRRKDFREIRAVLVVREDAPPPPITLICAERLE